MTARSLAIAVLLLLAPAARGEPPVALDDRLVVELVAQEPQLVTPTGVACDVRGNVWVIESNTHFPPKNYKGHPTDRVWVFPGVGAGGVGEAASGGGPAGAPGAPTQVLFCDGVQQGMSIAVTPAGDVYLVCRNEVVLLADKNHDLRPDRDAAGADRRTLVRLDTKATYPHNGLNGATLSPDGEFLYFCLGLNTGFDYAVVGADGSRVAGGGEGGSVWRCTPAGGKVERVATGFWNCHDLTFDAFGRLFAVDNDPDDIGPARLLDIIDGGDYGWKFKNGRKGVHPFTAWNGELPGTLPMVAGTGDAPSGILAYESDGLPADYRGQLLVTSWGDHVIHRYELKEKGASFTSTPIDIVRGGEDFRPVGIAQSPDGSVFVTDWVDKSYTLHGKGKLWRIRAAKPPREPGGSAAGPSVQVDGIAKLPIDERVKLLTHPRREARVAAGDALAAAGEAGVAALVRTLKTSADERARVQALWALARLDPTAWTGTARGARSAERWGGALLAEAARLTLRRGWQFLREDEAGPGARQPAEWLQGDSAAVARQALLALPANDDLPLPTSIPGAWRDDPFLTSAAVRALARSDQLADLLRDGPNSDTEWVVVVDLLAARRSGRPEGLGLVPKFLGHHSEAVRRLALQWVGEDRLKPFEPGVAAALRAGPVTRDLLAAYLACQEKLTAPVPEPGKPPAERSGQQFAAEFLFDARHDLKLRRIALELVDPADPKLPAAKLVALVEPMGLEAVKAVAWRDDAESQAALRRIAADDQQPADARREAVVGLSRSAVASADTKRVLTELLFAGPPVVRLDALRALRGALGPADAKRLVAGLSAEARKDRAGDLPPIDEREWAEQILLASKPTPDALDAADRQRLAALVPPRPADTVGWQALAAQGGDPGNGRRVFAVATGGRCYVCHQADNRGGQVGPDLSGLGRAMDRAKIVESIVEPSKEVAPLYVSTVVELKNGDTVSGVGLPEAGANWVSLADASGRRHRINADDVVSRRPEKLSVMPEGLAESMTVREFRDLVAYLEGRK